MSTGWCEMVKYTMQEANRPGLKMSINLANTGAYLRGPWDMKEDDPKQLTWTASTVSGPAKVSVLLETPSDKKYFQDVALMAIRINSNGKKYEDKSAVDLNGNWKDVIIEQVDEKLIAEEFIDLNDQLKNDELQWNVPEGEWRILRFGYHVIGDKGSVDYKFTTTAGNTEKVSVSIAPSLEITGTWNVTFVPATGAKAFETTFDKLTFWNEKTNPEIKFFSGTAVYINAFAFTAEQAKDTARLQLGEVHDIAHVWINGKDRGIVWTTPWLVDLTGTLKEGINELKLEVTNCWANRLIGDAGLPEHKRTTKTNVRLVPDRSEYKRGLQAFSAEDELLTSGLVGPVQMEFGQEQKIDCTR